MARKLAHNGGNSPSETDERAVERTDEHDEKLVINRRKYVTVGAAAMTALITGSGSIQASTSGGDEPAMYWTDFSEGQL